MNNSLHNNKLFEFSTYHRGVAENFEKNLVKYINDNVKGTSVRASSNIEIVGKQIISTFPNIVEAQHIGSRSYNIEGDILLITNTKAINIEIKMSDTFGKGTLANVSQKLFKALDENIIGYQDFHNNYVYEDITLKEYCWNLVGNSMGKKIRNASEYQTFLRSLRSSGSSIVTKISDITNQVKLEYNEYLVNEIKKIPDYLYKLTYLVRLLKDGIHTFADIKKGLAEFKTIDEYKSRSKYYVVYVYNASSETTCQIVDYSKALDTVSSIEANGQSIILKNKDNHIVLRFSTHWKNICQGGATPCFNVFHGTVNIAEILV